MEAILISGKQRAGKDTLANLLKDKLEVEGTFVLVKAIADDLKSEVAAMLGVSSHELEKMKVDDPKVRELFILVGELKRKIHGPLIWVRKLLNAVKCYYQWDKTTEYTVIIPDVRLKDEMDYLTTMFPEHVKIRVEASEEERNQRGVISSHNHYTETELDHFRFFDIVVENKTGVGFTDDTIDAIIKILESRTTAIESNR